MAIGGPPPNAQRPTKDVGKGAAGRYAFVAEVARGYLGTLWAARDFSDASPASSALVRHVAPLAAAGARAAIIEGARFGLGDGPGEIIEGRIHVDLVAPMADAEVLRSLLRTAALKHAADPPTLLGLAVRWLRAIETVHARAADAKSPHGFGGVHPDSVLVDTTGTILLFEPGVGAAASSREPWRGDPQRLGYFAPEQTEVRVVVDARTDVFAVGVVLWEALTARRLFPGNDAKTVRERVQRGPIARLDATRPSAGAGIATPIADAVARSLERHPAARFPSAAAMADALESLGAADAAGVGAWVSSLAEVAITKRRQILERAQAPAPDRVSRPPPSARGMTPPPPSVRNSAPPAPSVRNSAPPAPSVRNSAPPAPSVRNSAPPAPPSSRPPVVRASVPPRPGTTDDASIPSTENAPPPTPMADTAPAPVPESAPGTEPEPTEPAPVPDAMSSAPATSVPSTEPSATEVAPAAPDPGSAGAPSEPVAAEAPGATAGEADGDSPPDSDEIDVGEDEDTMMSAPDAEDRSIGPSPSKRPPALPSSMPPHGEGPVIIPSLEPLSGPMQTTSQLGALTAPAKTRPWDKRWVGLAAALVGIAGIAAGNFIGRIGKPKSVPHSERSLAPVLITAPSGSAEAESPAASAPPGPSAEASAAPAPAASAEPAPSAAPAEPEKAAHGETESPKRTGPAAPPSRGKGSGFKPGGI